MNPQIANVLEQQLLGAAQMMEQQIDAEIEKLDKMDDDDREELQRKRYAALKKQQDQKKEWLQLGHGKYEELAEEKDFFDTCKKSAKVVCHFYKDDTFRCKIVDKHLALLAQKHIETKFVKLNVEKSPFLTQRLHIKVIPTICLSRDSKTVDYIVGFTDLGGIDEFSTEMLEWRIACADVVNYSGDLSTPPGNKSKESKISFIGKKTIRQSGDDSSSDDDW